MERSLTGKMKAAAVLGLLIVAALVLKLLLVERFESVEELQEYMKQFGIFAPLVLIVFQALQVIVPVLPGYLGCAAGSIAFGTMTGFWCNYIGICAGSIIAFFLAKRFGLELVLGMFPEKTYEKWSRRIEKSRSYQVFLFVATLLPLFPDDFLCYFSGLMCMDKKRFIWIILLGKPWCILAYCIAFGMIR